MKLLRRRPVLPLAAKELVEQAARRRTYVVRVLYALLFCACFLFFFREQTAYAGRDPYSVLGRGRQFFEVLVALQFAGIFIFLPAMMSGVLAYEKERGSLPLLLLTGLRPWEIVIEKYLGRLVPMFTFLLLSLPFLALAYSFGGVSTSYLCSGALLLVLACLQVGAFALMMSSFCAATSQAFIGSYVLGALFYFSPLLLFLVFFSVTRRAPDVDEDVLCAFLPPYVFAEAGRRQFGQVLLRSIPIIVSTLVFLVMARVFVVRRAFATRRSMLLAIFRRLDRFMHRANRLVGGIVLIKDKSPLPGREPIAWREVNKKSLGKASHLARVVCLLSIPVMVIVVLLLAGGGYTSDAGDLLSVLLMFLGPLALLALIVPSANAFVSERTNQSLDLLLVAPLTGREIVLQKARARRRLAVVLGMVILMVMAVEAWVEGTPLLSHYVLSSVLSVAIYLPMCVWVSTWVGLKARTPARATMAALVVIVLWCVLPIIILAVLDATMSWDMDDFPQRYLPLLSPMWAPILTEIDGFDEFYHYTPLLPIGVNYLWHGAILIFVRWLCLARADRYLGRIPEGKLRLSRPVEERAH